MAFEVGASDGDKKLFIEEFSNFEAIFAWKNFNSFEFVDGKASGEKAGIVTINGKMLQVLKLLYVGNWNTLLHN